MLQECDQDQDLWLQDQRPTHSSQCLKDITLMHERLNNHCNNNNNNNNHNNVYGAVVLND